MAYQPCGVASRQRWVTGVSASAVGCDPASSVPGPATMRTIWTPVPMVSWVRPGTRSPVPRAAAAVSAAPAATGSPVGSPRSAAAGGGGGAGRDRQPGGQSEVSRGRRGEGAGGDAGVEQDRRQQAAADLEGVDDRGVPVLRRHVVEQGAGRVAGVGGDLSGEPGPNPVFGLQCPPSL